jgi:REP element-mobilizing transposase RayT
LFVTWRLFGSLPRKLVQTWPSFATYETALDSAAFGPVWLTDDRVAQVVADALDYGERELRLYELLAWVIMPNHVHVVVQPLTELKKITKTLKGYTARRANAILCREQEPFWHEESYDRWVRDRSALQRIVGYVESNPVNAGFVDREEDWKWSSAYARRTGLETCSTQEASTFSP